MSHCPHWDSDDELVVATCVFCNGREKPQMRPDPAEQKPTADDPRRNRAKVHYNKCLGCNGYKERQNRFCWRCADENTLAAAEAVDEFVASLGRKDRDLAFTAHLAADKAARRYHTAYTGLYPDEPPLAGRVPEAK